MESLGASIQAAMRSSAPPPAKLPTAHDIMARDGLVTFRPDQPLSEVIHTMLSRKISGAPVVDRDMQLLGIISEHDCLRAVAAGTYEGEPVDGKRAVRELMTDEVTTIAPDLNLFGIAHIFTTRGLRRLPVVRDGRVLGQVSRRDVLRAVAARMPTGS